MSSANNESIFACYQANAKLYPDKPHLIDKQTKTYTWRESLGEVEAIAKSLSTIFEEPGQSVAILSENCAEWVLIDFGITRAGHVLAPLFTTMTQEKCEYALKLADVKLLFLGRAANWDSIKGVVPDHVKVIALSSTESVDGALPYSNFIALGKDQPLPAMPDLDKPCLLTFTSGTTGYPKAVIHSLNTLFSGTKIFALQSKQYDLDETRFLCYLPLSHIGEKIVTLLHSLLVGASVTFNHHPSDHLHDLRETRPTFILGVPRIWEKMLQIVIKEFGNDAEQLKIRLQSDESDSLAGQIREFLGFSCVTYFLSSSAITPKSIKAWFESFGIEISDIYGQSELLPITLQKPGGTAARGSVGCAPPGCEVRIAENREIIGRGPGAAIGYFGDPEQTALTFVDGWVHTGDKGYLDEEGNLFILGRIQDTFKTSKGKYVAPGPIEEKFSKFDFVEQQCIWGLGLTHPVMLCTVGLSAIDKTNEEIEQSLQIFVEKLNNELESHERIGALIVSQELWTIEDGLLTHTHKIIRDNIYKKYKTKIEWIGEQMQNGNRHMFEWV